MPTIAAPPAPADAAAGVRFVDVTEASGLAGFQHRSGTPAKGYIIETTGSGVALWDFDGDGRLDIYLVNGSTLDAWQRQAPAPRAALFRNVGAGRFEDVTAAAGIANERWGQGVCVGDIDNDGFEDLYVTNFGVNRLYRNQRRRAIRGSSPDRPAWPSTAGRPAARSATTTATAGSISTWPATSRSIRSTCRRRRPRRPAAATALRASRTQGGAGRHGRGAHRRRRLCTYRGEPVMCGPRGLPGAPDHLFRNNRDGTFTRRDAGGRRGRREPRSTASASPGSTWTTTAGSISFVANDSGPNHVYRNLGNGRFEDVSYPSGAALDGNGREQAHMGVAVGDYDNDGRDDIHITNFADDFNVLYRNHDGRSFTDVSFRRAWRSRRFRSSAGARASSTTTTTAGSICSSSTATSTRRPIALPWNTSYAQRALLFRNLDGRAVRGGRRRGRSGADDAARVARVGGRRSRQRRRHRRGRQQRSTAPPLVAINDGGAAAGHWLTLRADRRSARRSARGTRSARRCSSPPAASAGAARWRAAAARSRSPTCACTSVSAGRPAVDRAGGAVGERADHTLRDPEGRRRLHHRSEDGRRGAVARLGHHKVVPSAATASRSRPSTVVDLLP